MIRYIIRFLLISPRLLGEQLIPGLFVCLLIAHSLTIKRISFTFFSVNKKIVSDAIAYKEMASSFYCNNA